MSILISEFRLRITFIVSIAFTVTLLSSCTKLDESFEGDLTQGQVSGNSSSNTAALLQGVYNSLEYTFPEFIL